MSRRDPRVPFAAAAAAAPPPDPSRIVPDPARSASPNAADAPENAPRTAPRRRPDANACTLVILAALATASPPARAQTDVRAAPASPDAAADAGADGPEAALDAAAGPDARDAAADADGGGTGGTTSASSLPATALGGRSIAAAIDAARVPLGGRVRYTVTVRHAPGDRVQLPRRDTNPFGPCRAVGAPREGRRDEGTLVARTYVFELVALEPTRDGLPPFPVSLVTPDGKVYELAAPAVPLEVVDPTANEPLSDVRPRGAKGADGKVDPVRPYVVYVRDWTLAWVLGIAGGALLVALAAVLVTRWWMRRRRPAEPAGPPPVPPYPAARERLARLRLEGAYARMGAKPFHVEMAEAVREYLGRRHGIDALEMTSEELLEALRSRPMGGITNLEMEQFLAACDFVKFAKAEPREREALDVLGTAERIVEQVERAMMELELRRAAEAAARAAAEAARAAAPGGPATLPAPATPPASPEAAAAAPPTPTSPPSPPRTPPEAPR